MDRHELVRRLRRGVDGNLPPQIGSASSAELLHPLKVQAAVLDGELVVAGAALAPTTPVPSSSAASAAQRQLVLCTGDNYSCAI